MSQGGLADQPYLGMSGIARSSLTDRAQVSAALSHNDSRYGVPATWAPLSIPTIHGQLDRELTGPAI